MASRSALAPHRLIAERIRNQIRDGRLHPGAPVPSYHDLMESHGVSVGTVRKAVMSLQFDGLIETVPGQGSFVARKASTWNMVGIAVIGEAEAPFLLGQLRVLNGEFERLCCDISVRFVPEATEKTLASLVSWAKRLDGALLTGWVPASVAKAVADSGAPTIQLGELLDGACPPNVSMVTPDVLSMMRMGVGHLMGLGHRRIVLCSQRGTRYFDLVTELFQRVTREYGLADGATEWHFDATRRRPWPELLAWLARQPGPPTAMLVEGASSVVPWLNENNWPVPERMSVLVTTETADTTLLPEGLSCIVGSTQEMLRRGVEILAEMIQRHVRVARVERIPPFLIPGKTCRVLASSETQSVFAGAQRKEAVRTANAE